MSLIFHEKAFNIPIEDGKYVRDFQDVIMYVRMSKSGLELTYENKKND